MSDDCSPRVVAPCILSDDKAIMLRPETVEALQKLFAGYKDEQRMLRAIARIEAFDLHNKNSKCEDLARAKNLLDKGIEDIEKDLLNKVGEEGDYGIILKAFDGAVARSSCRDLTDFINQCAEFDSNIGSHFNDDIQVYFNLRGDPLRRQSVLDIASLSELKEDFAREMEVLFSYTDLDRRER